MVWIAEEEAENSHAEEPSMTIKPRKAWAIIYSDGRFATSMLGEDDVEVFSQEHEAYTRALQWEYFTARTCDVVPVFITPVKKKKKAK